MMARNTTHGSGILLALLSLILTLSCICTVVSAAETTSSGSAEAQIAITNVSLDPAIFMQDDEGTVTVRIANSGPYPVGIDRVELLSDELQVVNYQTYDKVGTLGTGNSLSFTFILKANREDGTYFPIFYVDFTSAGSMRYPVPVRVDDTGIQVSVIESPEIFSAGEKDDVTLSISNPRDNEVNSVTIVPTGQGITPSQHSLFIGTLRPDEEKQVTFGITPEQSTDLIFDVSYRNGPTLHHETVAMPVTLGDRKVAAELVLNSIEVTGGGTALTIAGDVTNAGLKDAKSVIVTVGSPARPVEPNPVYVIGALEPDDFSSFEVSCTAPGASEIPLIVSYRDEDGKIYQETFEVSVRTTGGASSGSAQAQQTPPSMAGGSRRGGFMNFGSGVGLVPVIPIIIVILAGIGALVAWRKGYLHRIRDRFRK